MSDVLTNLIYLLISVGLTVGVGWALARSGRVFLLDVYGGNAELAQAVNRLLVVGFYLLNLGFVTLTMQTSANVSGAGQGLQLLSVKIGRCCWCSARCISPTWRCSPGGAAGLRPGNCWRTGGTA